MNIYIGNLNYRVREDDLKQVMEAYGAVDSVKIIKDRETGKSKGFGLLKWLTMKLQRKLLKSLTKKNYKDAKWLSKKLVLNNCF